MKQRDLGYGFDISGSVIRESLWNSSVLALRKINPSAKLVKILDSSINRPVLEVELLECEKYIVKIYYDSFRLLENECSAIDLLGDLPPFPSSYSVYEGNDFSAMSKPFLPGTDMRLLGGYNAWKDLDSVMLGDQVMGHILISHQRGVSGLDLDPRQMVVSPRRDFVYLPDLNVCRFAKDDFDLFMEGCEQDIERVNVIFNRN